MNDVVETPGVRSSCNAIQHLKAGLLAALALTLTACGSVGMKMPWTSSETPSGATGTVDYSLISANLLDTVSQYPKLNPLLATVQISPADGDFEQRVHSDMGERGYKLQEVAAGEGANGVNTDIRPTDESPLDAQLYVLSIGQISAERQFATIDGRTVPVSEMVVRGGEQRSIVLNDTDVFGSIDPAYSTVAFKPYAGPAIDSVLKPRSDLQSASVEAASEFKVVKHNIYDTMVSNYINLLEDYEEVDQHILVFPNDSLRLGDANKRTIEEYVAKMNPRTDVLSVIGCSHGKTEISNGNSLLALGRANRVKEAFLFSGIEHDQVLEEGCWAPQTFDEVMPQRGVVLTLKRRKET